MEQFRDIKGYEGDYQISNLGRVKSLKHGKERIMKSGYSTSGYLGVVLSSYGVKKNHTVHQLVAVSFLNHTRDGHNKVVNHIDFNKSNNKSTNLEIITTRDNTSRSHCKGTSKFTGVSFSSAHKKWLSKIWINKKRIHIGYFENEIDAHLAYQKKLNQIKLNCIIILNLLHLNNRSTT